MVLLTTQVTWLGAWTEYVRDVCLCESYTTIDTFKISFSDLCIIHLPDIFAFQAFKGDLETYTMLDASDKCKDLASHLHRSPFGKLLLENECKKFGHTAKVIHQANDTRWDSRCQNMEDVLYHEKCLVSLAGQGKLRVKPKDQPAYSLIPSLEEFRLIKAAVKVLKVCKISTKCMT